MNKMVLLFFTLGMLIPPRGAQGAWVDLSKGLNEADIRVVAVDPKDAKVVLAGSQRRLYRSADGGVSWKQSFGLRGSSDQLRFIYIDPADTRNIYVATDRGVRRSKDSGKHWDWFFEGMGDSSKKVFCVASSVRQPSRIWLGTQEGVIIADTGTNVFHFAEGIPKTAVSSILFDDGDAPKLWVASDKGIYKSADGGAHWDKVSDAIQAEPTAASESSLEQFDVEELSITAAFSSMIYLPWKSAFYAGTKNGVLEGLTDGTSWRPVQGQDLPEKRINQLARGTQTFYAATDKGLFEWNEKASMFQEMDEGLSSKEVHAAAYSSAGNYLLAATKRGLFRWSYPELTVPAPKEDTAAAIPAPSTKLILESFRAEPTIREIQDAAIRYAEVHPDKIKEWRRAAAKKALLPTVSLHGSENQNQNIDLDRGGTADPDKFIQGPDEKSVDWYVTLSWDLAELVWNNDQTSIDTRSRLLVELRDDVLNEVIHLYYERRRLQVDMAMAPSKEIPIQIEKEIRLQELTAGIDALTGGYLSARLGEIRPG